MRDLLQVMFEDGYFSASEAIALKKTCRELNENPVRLLRSLNLAPTAKIQSYFATHFGFQTLTNAEIQRLNSENEELLPQDLAKNLGLIPLALFGGILKIGMEDPLEKAVIRQLEFFLDTKVICVAATAQQIAQGLQNIYGLSASELKLSTLIEEAMGVAASRLQSNGFEDPHKTAHYPSDRDSVLEGQHDFHLSDDLSHLGIFETDADPVDDDERTSAIFENRFQESPEKEADVFETKGIFEEDPPPAREDDVASQNALLRELGLGGMESTEADPVENLDLMAELGLIDLPGDQKKSDEQKAPEMDLTDEIGALLATSNLTDEIGALLSAAELGEVEDSESVEPVAPLLEEESPSLEVNSHADELAELDLENELSLSEKLIMPATEQEAPAIPQEFLNELSSLVNSALVKFAFTKEKAKALEILNEKILELGANVELRADGTFLFSCPQYSFESVIDENAAMESDLGDRVAPALKKLKKMA